MGEHERRAAQQQQQQPPPTGPLPNGLLPNEAASVIRVLDSERWAKAEERTAELIACIQPNRPSEDRRIAVADYVQRLIMKCFHCEVFTFGSVPLKTYLPDGDIDLTAFSENQTLKDTWAHKVRDMLESEEKNENAEFRVKEVQYIQAEVKIIKCLVENIVVDISFNQLGGLCTLCFLEEVDNLIDRDHLFKRSIILIKAWCYYESRILGAHHGLISTYALETLVLYIFHVFNTFAGPLEVLYRFLEFFSKFDWDHFCVSLWGPVPISSLPGMTAESPRKDGGELLLSKLFLDACTSVYSMPPDPGQPFMSKHFNVIDPLRVNNNLGRSVSKGNFFRIRSAFAFGAKKLARLLDCPKEEIHYEINQFFMNTWERHGSGHRPDAPKNDLWRLKLPHPDQLSGSENLRTTSGMRTSNREASVDTTEGSHSVPSQHGNYPLDSLSRSSDPVSRTKSQKMYLNSNNARTFGWTRKEISSNQGSHSDKIQRSSRPDNVVSELQGRPIFARTRSSPELTDTYGEVSSQGKRNGASESGRGQISSTRLDNSRRKNLESDNMTSHSLMPSPDGPSSFRHHSSNQSFDGSTDANSASNSYHDESGLGAMSEEFASPIGAQGMHQEEQDIVNMMASSTALGFNGQVHVPFNLASGHIPFPLPPVLASMGYGHRAVSGMVPTNIPLIENPWGAMQFPQGLVSTPLTQYFPGMGLSSNPEDGMEPGSENFGPAEMNTVETDNEFWHDQERGSTAGFDLDNGSFEMQSNNKQQSTSASSNSFVPLSRIASSASASRFQQKLSKETQGSVREDYADTFPYQDIRGAEVYLDDRNASSRSSTTGHARSLRSKTSSEGSWDGSSTKSKSTREKRGRKPATSVVPPAVHGKGKSVSEYSSQADDDDKDWNQLSTAPTDMSERSVGPHSTAPLHMSRNQIPGFESAQTSGSESLIPFTQVILGPSSQQRTNDNSGGLPFAFVPTGPPVPFVAMVPLYNIPAESGTSEASASQFSGEEGPANSDSGQNFDLSEGLDQSEVLTTSNSTRRAAPVEPLDGKADILNSDFASHWQNLQYGRFCQNSRHPGPLIYPSPVMVPPMYLQGHVPWDGPGRPMSANMNLFTQLMSYGPRLVPVAPVQSLSNGPTANFYQHYVDEVPRYRGGTGTYLPNPKVSVRDRHSTNTRKGSYNFDRTDHHSDREGSWNFNSKSRAAGRSHSRNQVDKSSSRSDRLGTSESRPERVWSSHRNDIYPPYQSQNGPIWSQSAQSGSGNVAYGMYPLPSVNPGGVSSNGPTLPSVVMLYPYDHSTGYGSHAEQLEFGSLGPVGFTGVNEVSHLSEGVRSGGGFEDQRYHSSSTRRSSPEQPSSPHHLSRHI